MNETKKPCVVVAGYIVCGPIGGLVWHHLQYVLGLLQLGYDVLFVEDSQDYPSCYHPATFQLTKDPSYGLAFIQTVFAHHDLKGKWAYFDCHTNQWFGKSRAAVEAFADRAEIYLNLSGADPLREHFRKIPIRVFVDTDPAFTQIRHLTEAAAADVAKQHNRFFTFGENFGKKDCLIPDDGMAWLPTRQPVVLSAWKTGSFVKANAKWTTVMQWDSYREREYNEQIFGMKSLSFAPYLSLPQQLPTEKFELAVGNSTAPLADLIRNGWNPVNSQVPTQTPWTYQRFLSRSKGEWSVAKHGYVVSNSGWFSERTTGYLASGRPAVVQETGFSEFIATGRGLFSFASPDEAMAAIEDVNSNYERHCRWAREIAEDYFRSDKVLSSFLQQCTAATSIN